MFLQEPLLHNLDVYLWRIRAIQLKEACQTTGVSEHRVWTESHRVLWQSDRCAHFMLWLASCATVRKQVCLENILSLALCILHTSHFVTFQEEQYKGLLAEAAWKWTPLLYLKDYHFSPVSPPLHFSTRSEQCCRFNMVGRQVVLYKLDFFQHHFTLKLHVKSLHQLMIHVEEVETKE